MTLDEEKEVWLRVYCSAILRYVHPEAVEMAERALNIFKKRFEEKSK